MGLLEGKVAIITGASKGIGRALSVRFVKEGAAVIAAARSGDLVKETVAMATKNGGRVIPFIGDASVEADVRRMVDEGVKAFGKITTLVGNAGDGGPTKKVEEYTMEDWQYTIGSCLTSSYLCTRFAVPEMRKAGGGSIVYISSGAGRRGLPYRIGYCSAKAGQVGMTYGMARELAPEIRVNSVVPGAKTRTPRSPPVKGTRFTVPTAATPGMLRTASIISFFLSSGTSPSGSTRLRSMSARIAPCGWKPSGACCMRTMLRTATSEAVTSSMQIAICAPNNKSRRVNRRREVESTGPLFIACNGLLCRTCRAGSIPKSSALISINVSATR